MKRILTKIGILAALFVIAVLVISSRMNKQTTDNKTDLEAASLPVLSMEIDGNELNAATYRRSKLATRSLPRSA